MESQAHGFESRHIGTNAEDHRYMTKMLGFATLDELIDQAVPKVIRCDEPLRLTSAASAASEAEVTTRLRQIASGNQVLTSLIGMGYSGTITPPVIMRNVLENPGWHTAYTPYQAEISQGRLEVLFTFQTMICDLTGMEVANASLLDEATAAAEGMMLCRRLHRSEGNVFFVDADCHPQTIAVVRTRAEPLGIDVRVGDLVAEFPTSGCFGVLVQYPGSSGQVRDLRPIIARAHDAGALACVAADLLALVLLQAPAAAGADVVIGSAQRFGAPLGFGGPHAGYLAARATSMRSLPGRVIGVSVDSNGRPALRMALQTREQHIRREKATSNICTASVLLAVLAALYAQWHGPDGLRQIARRIHRLTATLAAGLRAGGVEIVNATFFDTLTTRVPGRARDVVAAALNRGINLRYVDVDTVGISLDETTTPEVVEAVWAAFGIESGYGSMPGEGSGEGSGSGWGEVAGEGVGAGFGAIPAAVMRTDEILTHPVFGRYHSETEMLRYLRRLADYDVGLDRCMIPLGSCTMKLNATTEMLPITWPEFSDIHPFVPWPQAGGYLEIICDLESMLAEITGFDAVTLQPNAGSQGELAGLLAIRAYHRSRGEAGRDVCLIPASAHGTNPASAAMAGMQVVVVGCDARGNVDLGDLADKATANADRLAAIMLTYPSTHGVYEEHLRELCDIVHAYGGQVYLDGANLNALVGLAKPGHLGADVTHLNLHKTFSIPHGGGGPGVGPVAVKEHLAPFLPNHPARVEGGPETSVGPVAGAPWGSAGILPISWAYITLMGGDGLTNATKAAVLAANYVAHRLCAHYPVLYCGEHGLVAHECIIDIRPITADCGVTVDDIAKRLIDYGFHAPTTSFPVPGTLMIEPTESESRQELDRFCDAMIAIRAEIDRVASGEWSFDDSPLRNAPHPAEDVAADEWSHPYSRELAAYPVAGLRRAKYWPPVSRVDNAYGDRHLTCTWSQA